MKSKFESFLNALKIVITPQNFKWAELTSTTEPYGQNLKLTVFESLGYLKLGRGEIFVAHFRACSTIDVMEVAGEFYHHLC